MTYKELEEYLSEIKDEKFAAFSQSLSNSDYISLGVKNPVLRQIIKDHKNDNELNTSDFKLGKYLEIDFIYFGLSLSRLNNVEEQLLFLKKNVRFAKSWAITDCLPSFMKKISFDQFYSFFLVTHKSNYTYERRIAYVLGLKQYKDNRILNVLPLIRINEEYIVMMAEAWLLSVIAITNEDKVFNYLKNCPDLTLKRKAISKINESFRFSQISKERFKSLR